MDKRRADVSYPALPEELHRGY